MTNQKQPPAEATGLRATRAKNAGREPVTRQLAQAGPVEGPAPSTAEQPGKPELPAEEGAASAVAAEEGIGFWGWTAIAGLGAMVFGVTKEGPNGIVDGTAPTLTGSTPSDDATAVAIGSNIVLTFGETVRAGVGGIVISNGVDTRTISVTDMSRVAISGNTVTINPAVNLQSNSTYHVQIASGVLTDAAGNAFAGIASTTDLNFTTEDLIVPVLTSSTPADDATAVLVGSDIVLTFSEAVQAGVGDVVISNGTDTRTISVMDATQVSVNGNTVTISPTANLQSNSTYHVQMASGVLTDAVGNAFAGIANTTDLNFTTEDLIAPTLLSSTPSDNATSVLVGSDIVLVFSESVLAGVGNIVISNGTDTRTISVVDATQVSINGNTVTINPTSALQSNSTYSVQMAGGVLTDAAGNAYAGITDPVSLGFDTQDLIVPTLTGSTPMDNATEVQAGSNIVLTFSETVQAGSGDIVISNGTDIRTVNVTDTMQVIVSGNTVSINPVSDLQSNSIYHVRFTSGVFLDLAGNPQAGITGATDLDFHTPDVDLALVETGIGGFVIHGQCAGVESRFSVSGAGDVNGDGLADLVIGAPSGAPAAGLYAGRSYVVYGQSAGAAIDLSAVSSGIGGFVINGQTTGDYSGQSVSGAGDVNGDGLADLVVGAPDSDPVAGNGAGRSYVVFGKSTGTSIDLSAVASGIGGFVINGQAAYEYSGASVSSAGDVDGDGLADLIVGAFHSAPAARPDAGRSYVVFGKSTGMSVDLSAVASGSGGFVINGQSAYEFSGFSVSSAGDVNGDGLADLIVGAFGSAAAALPDAGRSYVVFGKSTGMSIDLSAVASGVGGFVINGQCADDWSGASVSSAGDVNGDGLADVIVSAHRSDPAAGVDAGRSYVVFGKSNGGAIDLSAVASGIGGFVINGQCADDWSGASVSNAGDVNGDGLADVIVAARRSDPAAGVEAGRSYVVFGKSDGGAINLSAVASGVGGFVVNGQAASDFRGNSVSSAGDVNGDGLADLVVGAYQSDPAGLVVGKSHIIFGSTHGAFAQTAVDQYGTAGADAFSDAATAQTLVTGQGDDSLTATAASILYGGAGNDAFAINATMITALQSAFGSGGNTTRLSRIDGGTGIDTIVLSGSGLMLDLTLIANSAASNPDGGSRIDSIERIDLTGSGNNVLTLVPGDIRDIAGMNLFNEGNGWTGLGATVQRHQLVVDGDVGDALTVSGAWIDAGTVSSGGQAYRVYSHADSASQLLVDTDVAATIDLSPTLSGSTPTNNATDVLIGSHLVLTFSETVQAGTGDIVISNGTDARTISVTDATQVAISGNTVTINPAVNLQSNSTYHVQMARGVLEDAAGNAFMGITGPTALNFTTQDLIAPMLTGTTPADNATSVLIGSHVVLVFNEAVVAGQGDIVISNGTDTHTISVADATQVAMSGNTVTINPAVNLQSNSTYHVQMASGVLTDVAGNAFVGITGLTALNFDTQDLIAPTLTGSTPADNATDVRVGRDVVLTFDEAMQAGVGDIVISNGTDTRTISVTDTTQVTVSGSTVTINPTASLASISHYNVQMASGVLRDLAGNPFAGIAGAGALDFHTTGIDLSAVAVGSGGFAINGQSRGDHSGFSVSAAGDVNGDGLADVLVGALNGATAGGSYVGRSYVVFGSTGTTSINLSAVAAGSGGFVINGQCAEDRSGFSVANAGDVNGDGLADLVVGAPDSDPSAGSLAGRSYVVFGKVGRSAVDLSAVASGSGGFVINGQCAGDMGGNSVSGAGDVNGDGLADLIVGALYSDPAAGADAGRAYVVFGTSSGSAIDLSAVASGSGGFVINGRCAGDFSGKVASAGDVNGDGLADLVVGAFKSDPVGGDAGSTYVVFGQGAGTAIDLSAVSAGVGGFVINGQCAADWSGASVSGAGDVNGDGLADLVIGANRSDPAAKNSAGRSYVVFGQSNGTAIDLSAVAAGVGGFVINGQCAADQSGVSVSAAGDVNGDGLSDLIVGAERSDLPADEDAGRSYVVYGKSMGTPINLSAVAIGQHGFVINGQCAVNWSGGSVSGAGDVNGDGLADLVVGAQQTDSGAGRSYVIFGSTREAFAQTAVDQYGGGGADAFSDGGAAQTLVTGGGNDTLTATAASILYGGAGNDAFMISAAMITALQSVLGTGGNVSQLSRIAGGTGIDTIMLSGSGLTLDLTQIANQAGSNPDGGSRIDSVERIDLTGTGNNTVRLQLRDVLDMGSANTFIITGRKQLLVTGNAGDTLDIADGTGTIDWTQSGTASIDAVSCNVWNHNTSLATIYIQQTLTVI